MSGFNSQGRTLSFMAHNTPELIDIMIRYIITGMGSERLRGVNKTGDVSALMACCASVNFAEFPEQDLPDLLFLVPGYFIFYDSAFILIEFVLIFLPWPIIFNIERARNNHQ